MGAKSDEVFLFRILETILKNELLAKFPLFANNDEKNVSYAKNGWKISGIYHVSFERKWTS